MTGCEGWGDVRVRESAAESDREFSVFMCTNYAALHSSGDQIYSHAKIREIFHRAERTRVRFAFPLMDELGVSARVHFQWRFLAPRCVFPAEALFISLFLCFFSPFFFCSMHRASLLAILFFLRSLSSARLGTVPTRMISRAAIDR